MKDPYVVLGVSKDADKDLIESRYNELHELYSEQRFKAGEEGNEGARKLQELEEAWVVISANLESAKQNEAFGGDYGNVDSLIRSGKYNEAQDILDSITDRRGEWHYMQAIVFYKREWLTEAKAQLEMAIQDDPTNTKYKDSLNKLKISMGGGNPNQNATQQNFNNNPYNNGQNQTNNGQPNGQNNGQYNYQQPPQQQQDLSNCLSTCCCAYCLTDCLCSAMRCC